MLTIEDFSSLSVEDAYLAYRDCFESCQIFASRCADLNKRFDSLWDDYRMLYLTSKK